MRIIRFFLIKIFGGCTKKEYNMLKKKYQNLLDGTTNTDIVVCKKWEKLEMY